MEKHQPGEMPKEILEKKPECFKQWLRLPEPDAVAEKIVKEIMKSKGLQ